MPEKHHSKEHRPASHEQHHETHEHAGHEEKVRHAEHEHIKHNRKEDLEKIRHKAEREATKAEDYKVEQEDKDYKPTDSFANKELKTMAYERLLNRARRSLKPSERALSKVMHQPAVEKVSEATAKTVGRPSGILGGGLLAFTGTTAYYYITKHYGYDYNFFVFLALLVGGFVTGWLLELLLYILRSPQR